ncbi:Druantia anti-phage system protein DruA [Ferrimicrobium sp.]|uniref:Druantia anti-phage system protein DruA n=1 Tax=Ferrimicrobium sp. TaxID=2926050 RepID=UPI0026029332|nr:Druantia anti-phage system protein DruA [Ferrimicrobium sp.]
MAYSELLGGLAPIRFVIANTKAKTRRWCNLIASYCYLGYTTVAGAQLRYLTECSSGGTIGAIGFAASAWSCIPRDTHIGWDKATREARLLLLVVGDARFLILPQVGVVNLASHVLLPSPERLAARQRVPACTLSGLRRIRPLYRSELPSGALAAGREDQRSGQARLLQRIRSPNEGCLSLPSSPCLREHPRLTRVKVPEDIRLAWEDHARPGWPNVYDGITVTSVPM